MAFRGNESPMDFKWETYGPTDPSSPFHKFAMANDKKRKRTETEAKSFLVDMNMNLTTNEGSRTTFTSPAKSDFPTLREPNGQPYYLNSKDAPTSPWKSPSFTTPRKNFDIDFSSGPESSPVAAQTDGETPDGKALPAIPRGKEKEKKVKRNSLFNFYGRFAPSSGKGEIKKPMSDAVTKRVYKKRRQAQTFERQLALKKRDDDESETDTPETPKQRRNKKNKELPPIPEKQEGSIASFFRFVNQYPDAPSIFTKYLQVIFNAAILFSVLYLLWSFWATIKADIDKASEDVFQEALAETMACQKHFIDNRCNAASRLPALELSCARWEICMNKDPNAVRRASLSAQTFAQIFNSFVDEISIKTMIFLVLGFGMLFLVNNMMFSYYRRSQEHHDGHRVGSAQYGPGNQMAHMGQYAMSPGMPYQTPSQWQVEGQNISGQIEYDQSPSKNRGRNGSPEKKRLMLDHDHS